MSTGNRLTKDELRNEVKDYLISLREERIQRSRDVKERLKQLRHERTERLHDVRTSLSVMQSMRLKSQLEDGREDLRLSVKQLRAEAREMLKRYKETREIGFAVAEKGAENDTPSGSESALNYNEQLSESPSVIGRVAQPGESPENDHSLTTPPSSEEPAKASASSENVKEEGQSYGSMLSRVVVGLGTKDASTPREEPKPQKGNSLMGRIRKLASGDYRSAQKEAAPAPVQSNGSSPEVIQPVQPAAQASGSRVVDKQSEKGFETLNKTPEVPPVRSSVKDPVPVIIAVPANRPQEIEKEVQSDLLNIVGIGPSVLKRLERIGICTLQDLASTTVRHLEHSFGEYARLTDLGEWIEQARLMLRSK